MNCNIQELSPEITIRNNDSNALTSLVVGYTCGAVSHEMTWEGTLAQDATATVTFPGATFPEGIQTISFYISTPNGGTDMDASDNTMNKEFRVTLGQMVQLDLLTDAYADETTWDLVEDATSTVLYSNGSLSSEQHHVSEWCLGSGCYTFTVYDSYGDGMGGSWWGGEPGQVTITNLETSEIYGTIAGDGFSNEASIEFCIDPLAVNELVNDGISVYPNPATDVLHIQGNDIRTVQIIDNLGRVIFMKENIGNQIDIDLAGFPNGFVIVKIETATSSRLEKVVLSE